MVHKVWCHTTTRWMVIVCCVYSVGAAVVEDNGDHILILNITRYDTEVPCVLTVETVYAYAH